MRLFIAVNLEPQLRRQLFAAAATLRGTIAAFRWLPADTYHITIKFLGTVQETQLAGLVSALTQAAASVSPFEMTIGEVGAFPSRDRARIVWIGADASRLVPLHQSVEAVFAPLGFTTEPRPFHPHITIGRLAANMRSPELRELEKLATGSGFEGKVQAQSVDLMESKLSSSGARYEPIASAQLGVGVR